MAITYIGSYLEVSAAAAGTEDTADATFLNNIKGAATTKVGKVVSIGELGDNAEDVAFDLLEGGRKTHVNGVRDIGDVPVSCEFDSADAGQNRVRAVANSNTVVSFLITDSDNRVSAFNGVIANYRETERTASSYKGCMFTLRGQSRLVYGAA